MHVIKGITFSLLLAVGFSFYACNGSGGGHQGGGEKDTTQQAQTSKDTTSQGMMKDGLTVKPADVSPKFPKAELSLKKPKDGESFEPGDIQFKYDVTNYELGVQTKDAGERMIAKSSGGQHIHLILNNGPYTAHYEPEFKKALDKGHYVALSFFARSYHESVKTDQAHQLIQFNVGEVDSTTDLSKPMVFYSRPKGTYKGKDAKKILFDFYLKNTSISKDGNKVKLTIDGKTSFTFDKWIPYTVEGLSMGKHTFTIELVDQNGELVDSPFNSVSRDIMLKKGKKKEA